MKWIENGQRIRGDYLMTDGIIQQVFEKYTLYDLNNSNLSLEDIKQELIEKIKREFQYCKPLLSLDKYTTLQKRLIGDSHD